MPTIERAKIAPEQAHHEASLHLAAFGTLEIRTNANLDNGQWHQLMVRSDSEALVYRTCVNNGNACPAKIRAWRKFVAQSRDLTGLALLSAVNTRINQLVVYGNDIDVYGQKDHWATPLETLSRKGDCEDYAILKYMTLSELGFNEHLMKIIIVKNKKTNIAHAIVAVNMDGKIWILDNRRQMVAEESKISNYQALYSLNRYGTWLNLAVRRVKPITVAERRLGVSSTQLEVTRSQPANGLAQVRSAALMPPDVIAAHN